MMMMMMTKEKNETKKKMTKKQTSPNSNNARNGLQPRNGKTKISTKTCVILNRALNFFT